MKEAEENKQHKSIIGALRAAAPKWELSRLLLMIAFITCNSNLVPLLEGLCRSNSCRFEFSVYGVFAGIEPTSSGLTVPRSDHLS